MTIFIHAIVDRQESAAGLIAVVDIWPLFDKPFQLVALDSESSVLLAIVDERSRRLHTSKHDVLILRR
jgi:hypothetical protein